MSIATKFPKSQSIAGFDIKDPSLVLYLPLWHPYSDMTGATIYSYDKNRFTGTVTGGIWPREGWEADGDDNISVVDAALLSAFTAFTVLVWFKIPSGGDGYMALINKIIWATAKEWYLSLGQAGGGGDDSTGIQLAIYDQTDGGDIVCSETTAVNYKNNKWHCFVASFGGATDGSDMTLDVDGVSKAVTPTVTGTFTLIRDTVQPVRIGLFSGLNRDLTGTIGELTIWNKQLSAGERGKAYQGTRGRY